MKFTLFTKRLFVMAILLLVCKASFAQSTVVFMLPSLPMSGTITVNGENSFELKGDVKKVTKAAAGMKYDLVQRTDVYRRCILHEEGKTLFSYKGAFQNVVSGDCLYYASEIQLDLVEGETYYVIVKRYGNNDQKLELLPEKKALKFIGGKGCAQMPDVIIE